MSNVGVTTIDKYFVQYSSNSFDRTILLLSKGKQIAWLIFKPNGTTLPQDYEKEGKAYLHYHLEDFQNIVDILRNEKPLALLWSGSGPNFENSICSGDEPIGETEK